MLLKAWMHFDEFLSEHKSKIWVVVYIAIIVFLVWLGLSAPLTLGPNTEGNR